MTKQELKNSIIQKKSCLCIGLDTDITKIPKHLLSSSDPVFEFNKQLIDATNDVCVAYKLNTAFYESLGSVGWEALEKTAHYLKEFKNIFTIADAKRGDIGNTSTMYAQAFFGLMNFDAVTVAPYMGSDSVTPFLQYEGKWVILLALTSNKGADDFQLTKNVSNAFIYQQVLEVSQKWGNAENMMYVVGATRPEMLEEIRKQIPNHFLLVPGVGAQGGDIKEVFKYGKNEDIGLLINSSRGIIYASNKEDFAVKAREEAIKLNNELTIQLR
ncbi:MAG: orotidine-5'-phosphate decarboxylase [Bacteroidetes bacterium]|nr:orotidine-5'-phosphate decarboxylase [Bacteroidota bacterium]